MAKDQKSGIINAIRAAALIAMLVIIILLGPRLVSLTPEEILSFTPENPWLAAGLFILLYALKSMTIVFPVVVITLAAGFILPPVTAFIVNMAGMLVCLTLPYFIGRFMGKAAVEKMASGRKRFRQVGDILNENEFFASYILRVINMLPMDLVGMLLGAMDFKFGVFLAGSFVGILPGLITTTIIGSEITNPTSPAFIGAAAASVAISGASILIYRNIKKRNRRE